MHAAGFLEGYLLSEHIYNHKSNIIEYDARQYLNQSDFPPELYSFVESTRRHLEEQVSARSSNDPFWSTVALLYEQVKGLTEGYNKASPEHPMDLATMYMYQSTGSLIDLYSYNLTKGMSSVELTDFWAERNRCSGLVRLLGDNSELYVAHSTRLFYGSLNRVLKYYDFALHSPSMTSSRVAMSSYPGLLFSGDDFYVLSSGLSVIETSISIYNTTLLANPMRPDVLPEWVRVMVANRMARTGREVRRPPNLSEEDDEWVSVFNHENSGTYNSQFLVVDYKLFEAGAAVLKPGLFWVLEQYPGGVSARDVTDTLAQQRYFGSYNVPYLDETYEICNYTAAAAADARAAFWNDRYLCCRAQILRRDAVTVASLADMQNLLRSNRYKTDPLSVDPMYKEADPGAALGSRFDLRTGQLARPNAVGESDAKITSSRMAALMSFTAVAGPVHSDDPADGLPEFSWATAHVSVPHRGLPDSFDFDWIVFHPEDLVVPIVMVVCIAVAAAVCVALALFAGLLLMRKWRAKRASGYVAISDTSVDAVGMW